MGLKSYLFKSVDETSRDLASTVEVRRHQLESTLSVAGESNVQNLAGLKDAMNAEVRKSRFQPSPKSLE
jgi:hypothetical protein